MSNEAQTQAFINVVNEETREKILKLDKKLRVLRAEVESKLSGMMLFRGENPEGYKEGLLHMQHELNVAIESISELVNISIIPQLQDLPILSGSAMEEFTEILSSSIDDLSVKLFD